MRSSLFAARQSAVPPAPMPEGSDLFLRRANRVFINGDQLNVWQGDDTTVSAPGFTQTVLGQAGATPIVELDTN